MWNVLVLVHSLALAIAAARSTHPLEIQKHTCKNGLEILVVENHAVPLITVEIAARNGSMTEPPAYNGLSHLYEHMFFKANAVIPNQEAYLARMRELGIVFNGTTNTERVNYFFTTTSDHLKDAMVFMRDAVVTPKFDAKDLERERVVVTGEIDRNEANPFYYLSHAVRQHVFWKYPSYKDPLGNRATVLAATVEKMKTIQKRYYVPGNSVLVVTGDVQAADIFAQADELYARWEPAEDPFKKHPLVKHPALRKSEVVLVEQPVQAVDGVIEWLGPSTVGPSVSVSYAADVLSLAIAERSSKFSKALVDSGACVAVAFGWLTQMNTGPITLNFEATPDKVDACVQAMFAELPKMVADDYLTDDEMRNAAHTLEVQDVLGRESPSAYAHTITFWWTSAGLDYYLGYVDKLYQVKRADIARFMNEFVLGKPFVLGVMLSPELKAKGFDVAHFEALAGIKGARKAAGVSR
jgi:zinc protease